MARTAGNGYEVIMSDKTDTEQENDAEDDGENDGEND